ncbi:related to Extracellular metalloprotease SMAC_06893 [Ramularia collo-cygni]|uniref:Related to Extracellular metalloprotease SMAC_06893 n=1 Tax=Ramularia collo-cygni TaxID=112498 RepID=A0A2D3VG95_9PEZI|nr:related to Extracellular metalloprotease SMAC_06893 [Ramularia collo-cygni]CZT19683.1 related to Extracellular metalloprotease SMAC_06893 [Ramularia collo-cygni]
MKSLITIVLVAFAVVASAALNGNITHFVDPATNLTIKHFNCGVSRASASKHYNETIRFLSRNTRHSQIGIGTRAPAVVKRQKISPALVINTYLHLLTTTAKAGTVTKKQATAQIATLNRAYKPIGITFKLINVSITTNDAWAVAEGSNMDAVKEALRKGSYADLNLYFHSDLTGGILGTCTLPSQVTAGMARSQYASDGCNINANTMPGGAMTGYNAGMTAVHETGHWLGLLHTFEGYSCTGDGDSIADTPMQATSTDGCPSEPAKDSCPGVTGVDAIHNYMDYSSDSCYTSFTPGQVTRIGTLWNQYRKGF